MNCERIRDFLDAYVDQELDVLTTINIERHLTNCDGCREMVGRYGDLQSKLKAQLPYFQAPVSLQRKIRLELRSVQHERRNRSTGARPLWAIAATVLILVAPCWVLLRIHTSPTREQLLADQVVSSHIRSLMANHLLDVPSSEQHTVKPWFNGKLDFAPTIRDLSSKGFLLLGGRLDYLDERAVAAAVYRRRQHPINLFVWPSSEPDSKFTIITIRGYHIVHSTQAHWTYWAVSDLNSGELKEFVQYLEK